MPENFIRMTRQSWQDKGEGDLVMRVSEYCKNLLAKTAPPALPEHVTREMDSIVEEADKRLG
jgi:trimethylamine:corrinoid methyltransferase-like protein